MGRTATEVRIQERTARARLKARHHPYWRVVAPGRHIGYYRGARSGSWIARYRDAGSTADYRTLALGKADDVALADGGEVLSWKQALDKASVWFKRQEEGEPIAATALDDDSDPDMTVGQAVAAYILMRDAREAARAGRTKRSSASSKLIPHLVVRDPQLCAVKLRDLRETHLRNWQRRLPAMAGSSKQRILSELKAALNDAFLEHRRALPGDLHVVIKFGCRPVFAEDLSGEPVSRDNQVLPDETIRTILAHVAAQDKDGDLHALCVVLAATGARFSQIARMKVRDVDLDQSWLFVPPSRKGRGKRIGANTRIRVGPDVIALLRSRVEGRAADEVLLQRWHYRQATKTRWERVGRDAWKTPSEMRRWWGDAAKAAGVPDVIPYALRHSSIVRALRANIPIRLVAALHDTSVAMIEKHYARWITESLDDIAARAIVPLLSQAA